MFRKISFGVILAISVFIVQQNFLNSKFILTSFVANAADTTEYRWGNSYKNDKLQKNDSAAAQLLAAYGGHYLGPDSPVIFLTFDMGYENGYTKNILDVLKNHNATAAFFVVESYIQKNPELIARMSSEGHIVGNHSVHHKNMANILGFEEFAAELAGVEKAYSQVTGQQMPKFFRPPAGVFSERALKYAKDLGYTAIMWSFAYEDWDNKKQPSRDFALSKILPRTHNGEIALLHATSKTNSEILDHVLTEWEKRGYCFKSLNEL